MHDQPWMRPAAALSLAGLLLVTGCTGGNGIVAGGNAKIGHLSAMTLSKPCSGATQIYHLRAENTGSAYLSYNVTRRPHAVKEAYAAETTVVPDATLAAGASYDFDVAVSAPTEVYVRDLMNRPRDPIYLFLSYNCKPKKEEQVVRRH